MKKLTALLLGTVVSIAFTADAFAENKQMAMVKDYLSSNNGSTGGYLGVSYNYGSIDDVSATYIRKSGNSNWQLDDGEGGQVAFGFDFGKIRLDWRLGALYSNVVSIDNAKQDPLSSDEAVVGYSTFNINLDLYRFHLGDMLKAGWPGTPFNIDVAATPYIGVGWGYGGGWMTGKKISTPRTQGTIEPAGHGQAVSLEGGVLINITDWAGITLGYNYLEVELEGHQTLTGGDVQSHMASVGFRFTY